MAKLDKYRLGMADTWTFKHDGTVQVGDAVTFVEQGVVGRGEPDVPFVGKVIAIDDRGMATVQVGGMMVVKQDGSINPPGYATVAVTGDGRIKVSAGAHKVLVIEEDDTTGEIAVYLS